MSKPRILLFSYSDLGYRAIEFLHSRGHNVVGLFTHENNPAEFPWYRTPDTFAPEHGIPVYTPGKLNTEEWIEKVRAIKPDLIFSIYYRNMIPTKILDIPSLGSYNMHGSYLPQIRGCAPTNWALAIGATETGATLHHMTAGADAGDIVDQEKVLIDPEENGKELFFKVSDAAMKVLDRQIDKLCAGTAPRTKQDESQATYYGRRKPEDGQINWSKTAVEAFNLVRAVAYPYPGAFTDIEGKRLMIWWGKPKEGGSSNSLIPGQIASLSPLTIATSEGVLEINSSSWVDPTDTSHYVDPPVLKIGQIIEQIGHAA